MCIIVDANTFHKFKDPNNEDMEPVWTWLEKRGGKIAYSDTEKLEEEWNRGGMQNLRNRLRRTGKLKIVSPQDVEEKANELSGEIESNDEHIIALAIIAGVKILVSYREGDSDLFTDFKNRELVGGRVYTRKAHAQRMLRKDTCP
ncbi:hypothetical protein F4009_19180 [Candidatus Poribacteria bacterium]|nr:hypothetical protein [Candidatus Poribacteria bacterium]MYH82963.1 hypothetical protein [Candidatus Poribacteria bacterium]MYK96089.1 hypothetical protein [Candidatus Poribacteria bacterium]